MGNGDVDVTRQSRDQVLGVFVHGTQVEMFQGRTLLFFPESNFDFLEGVLFHRQ